MKKRFFNEILTENSKYSLMRVIALLGCILGSICIISSIIGFFLCYDGWNILLLSGVGAIATAQGFKMGQKKYENG